MQDGKASINSSKMIVTIVSDHMLNFLITKNL